MKHGFVLFNHIIDHWNIIMKEFEMDYNLQHHVNNIYLIFFFVAIKSFIFFQVINLFDVNQQHVVLIVGNALYILISFALFLYMKQRKVSFFFLSLLS